MSQQLRVFIERVERLQEERKTIADDIADVFREMEDAGFDKAAAKVVLRIRADADGMAKWTERSAIVDSYLAGLGMLLPRAGARAHGIIEQFSPDPHTSAAADGQPSIPSSDASGAKSDGAFPIVGRAGVEPGHTSRQAEQAILVSRFVIRLNASTVAKGAWRHQSSSPERARLDWIPLRAAFSRVIAGLNLIGRLARGSFACLQACKQPARVLHVLFRPLLRVPLFHERNSNEGSKPCPEIRFPRSEKRLLGLR